jgi:two-component system chemotaxis response regulator CheY
MLELLWFLLFGKEELVKKSLLLGAKNYIVKPLDRKKVLERIGTAVK